ncbi:CG8851, partial [Drosophila busckii]
SDEIGEKLKLELCKYKQELKDYNETTKELEEKYMKINYELNAMQDQFTGAQAEEEVEQIDRSYCVSATSIGSSLTLQEQYRSNTSFMTVLAAQSSVEQLAKPRVQRGNKNTRRKVSAEELMDTLAKRHARRHLNTTEDQENSPAMLKDMFNVLKDVMNTQPQHKMEREQNDYKQLYSTIKSLKSEQLQFKTLIRQQQERLSDYHTRCVKAQEIMKTQKHELDKLQVNNKQLESSIFHDFDTLRSKIDAKLKHVSQLPGKMREEHSKYEKVMRENCLLADKLQQLQQEAAQLRAKIDELGKRKLVTVNRLKAAERDLKIFKNYNAALKSEKRRIADELTSTKQQLETLQLASKRQLVRHREQTEKQRRELQKRIFDLELKLSRSQNSTTSLIQERDSLIAELQTQLHTLVHNFEVSQKHIRVLRRHIYSMTTGAHASCSSSAGAGIPSGSGAGISSATTRDPITRVSQHSQSCNVTGTGVRISSSRSLKHRS